MDFNSIGRVDGHNMQYLAKDYIVELFTNDIDLLEYLLGSMNHSIITPNFCFPFYLT